jgi:cobalt-zinc-cadmium efflux system outer membrane protein
LKALRAEQRALQAETVQAGLRPNPEFGLKVENFGGTEDARGFNDVEITSAISQRLELGGKRQKREVVAKLKAQALAANVESVAQEVAIQADRAFTSLLAAQKLREIAGRNVASSKEQVSTLEALVEAGAGSNIDSNKARLELSEAHELLDEARSDEAKAATRLSQLWGSGAGDIRASGTLDSTGGSLAPIAPDRIIADHPSTRAAALGFAANQATYTLQKAHRISDITVSGGVRELGEREGAAALVGVSIPLPLFDQNQGNIQAAEERVIKARAEGEVAESRFRRQLNELNADLTAAQNRVADLDSQTIAAARQALDDTETAYAAGVKSLLELIDARKTLFATERREVEARADLQRASNALLRFSQ